MNGGRLAKRDGPFADLDESGVAVRSTKRHSPNDVAVSSGKNKGRWTANEAYP